jgi:hypothetical protein
VTLLEVLEPPSRLPNNSLFADSVARLVSAATVEAVLVEVLLAPAADAEGWLLATLPIDIMVPIATAGIRGIGRRSNNLRRILDAPITVRQRSHFYTLACAATLY